MPWRCSAHSRAAEDTQRKLRSWVALGRIVTMKIDFQKYELANGLQVILHEDHSDPVVAVYVTYHVGSARERHGLTGFAHLFEHMLFQGSENVPEGEHFRLIQEAGGTLNGSTSTDRTNYYEILPSNGLELALWLEADRMGFLLPAMTQAKLDNQRDVVKNERRQSYENRPYGLAYETILEALYAPEHPYSWPTIGSMADIDAATLEEVGKFFRRWYGPNNATLAIGGRFRSRRGARARGAHLRWHSARGRRWTSRPRGRPSSTASGAACCRIECSCHSSTWAWPTVAAGHPDEAALDLLGDVLSAKPGVDSRCGAHGG